MNKEQFFKTAKTCYIAFYQNDIDFYSIINRYANDTNCDIVEIRIDSYFENSNNVNGYIDLINNATEILHNNNKKVIATVRTLQDGSNYRLDFVTYYSILEKIYLNTNVDIVDVEYRYYLLLKDKLRSLFDNRKLIIMSYHEFVDKFDKKKLNILLQNLIDTNADIVKFAHITHKKQEVFELMETAKNIQKKAKKNNIFVIIAMGEIGLVSRIFTEYTNTKIVYLDNEEKDIGPIGNINHKRYKELRKKIKELI